MRAGLFIFVCCLLGHVVAKKVVNLPFDGQYIALNVRLNIGTPPQQVSFAVLDRMHHDEPLIVANSGSFPQGMFYRNESTSFQQLQPLLNYMRVQVGVNATDVLKLQAGDEELNVQLPIRYYDQPFTDLVNGIYVHYDATAFGLNRPIDGQQSFFQSVLGPFEEKTVVFSYDQMLGSPSYNISGLLTLGGKAEDRCADDWVIQPEVPWKQPEDQWSMAVDELSFGTYTFDSPGTVILQPTWFELWMPQKQLDALMQTLGVTSAMHVPCDTQVEIVFSVGGKEIHVKPDEYLLPNRDADDCFLHILTGADKQFLLPYTVLRRHCLLLDYSADYSVGFATRLSQA